MSTANTDSRGRRTRRSSGSAEQVPVSAARATRRCAIYTRKSTTEGLDSGFSSLDAQREAGELYVRSQAGNGWLALPTRYDDGGFTGGSLERPALARLMEDVERGAVDAVVVAKVDRLSRSLLDFARLMERFERHGVHFVSVTQHFDTSTSMGRLVLNLLLSFAQFEREMIAERTRDKIRASRRHGKWTGGAVPFGYRVVDKRLVPDAEQSKVVCRIFELYAKDGSTSAIAWRLNREGQKSATGNGRAKPWNKDKLSRILRNPIYAGLIPCGKEVHPGEHEPLVSRETFDAALSKIQARKTVFGRKSDPEYFLRGLLRCGQCGYAIVPATTKAHGRKYRYYRCGIHDNSGTSRCGGSELPAAAFEAFVLGELRKIAERKRFGEVLETGLEARAERLRREISNIPREIAEESGRAGQLATALSHLSGAARRGPETELAAIGEKLRSLEERLYEAERDLRAIDTKLLAEAEWLGACIDDGSAWTTDDLRDRARVCRGLLREIVVTGGGDRVELCLADWIVKIEGDSTQEPA
jgi:site-specific DNA recombinase